MSKQKNQSNQPPNQIESKTTKLYTLIQGDGGFIIVTVGMDDNGKVAFINKGLPEVYAIAINELNKKIRADLDI